jgi:hypothetical protein
MAGGTCLGADVLGSFDRLTAPSHCGWLLVLTRSVHRPGPEPGEQCEDCCTQKHTPHPNPPISELAPFLASDSNYSRLSGIGIAAADVSRAIRRVSAIQDPKSCAILLMEDLDGAQEPPG